MELGISGQALGETMSFERIVAVAKKYGVRHIELWPCNAPGEGFGYGNRDLGAVARIAERENVSIHCVTLEAAFCEAAVETPEFYTKLMKETVDAAAALGAKLVNHYCYFIHLKEKPDFDRMERYWGPALDYAKKKGVTLVLENEAHDATRRPELMKAILDRFCDPDFLTNFDATNYFHASAEAFPYGYELLKPRIGYIHLKDACLHREGTGQPPEHLGAPMSGLLEPGRIQYAPIPEGCVNIAGLLTAVRRDGIYRGVCTLEPHTRPECVEMFYEKESGWLRRAGLID